MPRAGDRFGEFVLRREIGKGAMGTVWEAHQPSLDRTVALKVLLAGTSSDPVWVARFKAEAGQAARLSHPGILPVYAIGETDGQHWFAMELVDGEDVSKRLQRTGVIPPREAARIVKAAAEALHHAHENGVVHRDVKPANLMVRKDGRVVVTDFGLSKHVSSGALTTTGLLVGTPYYMCPELISGRGEGVGPPADVYGLGVTLYEMCVGRVPFQAENAMALLKRIAEQEPTPPSKVSPSIARDLETIILTCLAKRPERRYASAKDLALDLGRYLEGLPITRRRPGLVERAGRFATRNRLAVGVAAVAVLALSGALLLFSSEMESKDEEYRKQIEALTKEAERLSAEGSTDEAEEQFAKIAEIARSQPGGQDDARRAEEHKMLMRLQGGKPISKEHADLLESMGTGTSARVVMKADATDAKVALMAIPGPSKPEEATLPLEGRNLAPGFYRFHVSAPGRMPTIATAFLPPGGKATIEIALPKADATTTGMISYGGTWLPPAGSFSGGVAGAGLVLERQQAPYLLDSKRVTVRDYAAFVEAQPKDERAPLIPKGWKGVGPPRSRMDQPIVGLSIEQAEAYAVSKGKRVPLEGELRNAAAPGFIAPMPDAPPKGAPDPKDPEDRRTTLGHVGAFLERFEGLADWDGDPEWALSPLGQGQGRPWPMGGIEGKRTPFLVAAVAARVTLRLAR